MGFMDKAKKLAEQAQTKLDEAQKQFNERQSGSGASQGPAVEYDKHGRPVPQQPPATESATPASATEHATPAPAPQPAPPAPHGDPLAGEAAASAPPEPDTSAPVPDPSSPSLPQGHEDDENKPDYAPPKLSGGDPLAP